MQKAGMVGMNNANAIRVLDIMVSDLYRGIKDLKNSSPLRDVLAQRIEAIERAQDALRQWDEHLISLHQKEK